MRHYSSDALFNNTKEPGIKAELFEFLPNEEN